MKHRNLVLLAVGLALGAGACHSDETPDAVRQAAGKLASVPPDTITASAIPGLYEVMLGTDMIYVSADGRYAVTGSIVEIDTRRNLSEASRDAIRRKAVQGVDEKEMIVFAGENPTHSIYVFTDTRCGYCRKLHSEVAELNGRGIAVRYLSFPAAGPESVTEAESVWCADDRQAALTAAKAGNPVEARTCENPVKRHLELGQKLGVSGTPAIVLENGELWPGYMPPDRMEKVVKGTRPSP